MRQTITKLMNNSLREAFDVIDYMRRGQITAVEIKRFLDLFPATIDQYHTGRADITQEDVDGLIRRFNKDK